MKRIHVFISGRVQGVFFRANTQKAALSFNLAGWVRNLPDGRVEAVFEGNDGDVDAMLEWCKKGPPFARVMDVKVIEEPFSGEFRQFSIRY
ncbi:MAG: acylphosphatase [Syntrophales bacterium]|nr:acylphosphatase [Syntrophales bacterium]